MRLSNKILPQITNKSLVKPPVGYLNLPVKVLQFGTGVLLRALPDYLIDKANWQGIFNGRIVVVKSTNTGNTDAFDQQDNLYTLMIKGIANERLVEETIISSAISHVLSASNEWELILKEAENPDLQLIISNTTEVGIQLLKEDINSTPPESFPAKLLSLLYHRYKVLGGSKNDGLIIVPTELLPNNATVLKDILIDLIEFNELEPAFRNWLDEDNYFCNSLVDRIVPGSPSELDRRLFEQNMHYQDELLIVSEPYCLWAIEGNAEVKSALSFEKADEGVIIVPDIEMYRELKLRLLNGTHTLSCALAFLSGFETVKEAMDDPSFLGFVQDTMGEIALSIPYKMDLQVARDFSKTVIDRFKNPYIRHLWINIAQQYTTKIKMRVVPLLEEYYKLYHKVPPYMTKGFAAYLFFMSNIEKTGSGYSGKYKQLTYPVYDLWAGYFHTVSNRIPPSAFALTVLKNDELWGKDLNLYPGFTDAVQQNIDQMMVNGLILSLD